MTEVSGSPRFTLHLDAGWELNMVALSSVRLAFLSFLATALVRSNSADIPLVSSGEFKTVH